MIRPRDNHFPRSAKTAGQYFKNSHVHFDSKTTVHQALLLSHDQPFILFKVNYINKLLEGMLAGDVLPVGVLHITRQHASYAIIVASSSGRGVVDSSSRISRPRAAPAAPRLPSVPSPCPCAPPAVRAAGCNGFCGDGDSPCHRAILVALIGQGHRGPPVPRGHESRGPLHLGAPLGS